MCAVTSFLNNCNLWRRHSNKRSNSLSILLSIFGLLENCFTTCYMWDMAVKLHVSWASQYIPATVATFQ